MMIKTSTLFDFIIFAALFDGACQTQSIHTICIVLCSPVFSQESLVSREFLTTSVDCSNELIMTQ